MAGLQPLGEVAFFFGTFNPVHWGHVRMAEAAKTRFGFHQVVLIPAGTPPWKASDPELVTANHRLAMARLAIEGLEGLAVDGLETEREGPSYTADTLCLLAERYPQLQPHQRIPMVIGSDTLAGLHQWYQSETLIARCVFLQVVRGQDAPVIALPQGSVVEPLVTIPLPMPSMPQASRHIRDKVRRGETITEDVPPAVGHYIVQHGLWQSKQPSLEPV